MADQTPLYFPHDWPYPITIVQFHVKPNDHIDRGTRLLTYSFRSAAAAPSPDAPPESLFGTWDSPIEGSFNKWGFKERDKITRERATSRPAIHVTEPCKHGIQMGGLCALCGKDMTRSDHAGFSDASRATIQMNHTSNGPMVSYEEAQRIERETAQHLLQVRKLSLIVDLDQTIVHATVDPTVGEWIAEGEAWEARQKSKAEAAERRRKREERKMSKEEGGEEGEGSGDETDSTTDSDDTVSDSEEEINPNWEALKDVKSFRLGPESFGAPSSRSKGKEKAMDHGCLYFVKPRPGWQEFLTSVAAKYEMHVYTMGTRAYAEEVCAAIDPDGKFFGGRILSRDESGSMTQKSLERLFPVDTSMVVIIDDRADVWGWSANLIKVIPYDFFVGIGDINSSFLPKVDPSSALMSSPSSKPAPTASPSSSAQTSSASTPNTASPTLSATSSETAVEGVPGELSKAEMIEENSAALEAQVEERPLAKMQEQLQDDTPAALSTEEDRGEAKAENASKPGSPKPTRKALLRNDDTELQRVKKFLDKVHSRFYEAYEKRPPDRDQHQSKQSKRRSSAPIPYSATYIIPRLRSETLAGVHILFSSVIPLDMKPESSEMWRMAHAFGARCHTELTSEITHLVANKRGTQKVDAARKRRGIKVVWLAWFTDSIARWERQDETPYLLDGPQATRPSDEAEETASSSPSPVLEPQQISSDPEPDADDWDVDREKGVSKEGEGENAEGEGEGGEGEGEEGEEGEDSEMQPVVLGTEDGVKLDEVSWEEANAELEAFLAEGDSDEEDDMEGDDARSVGDGSGSERKKISEDDTEDTSSVGSVSVSGTPSRGRIKRKRLRSITPSSAAGAEDDALRSPLSKRKKLVADRRNSSRLRESVSSAALARAQEEAYGIGSEKEEAEDVMMGAEAEEEEEGTEADDDFDFLAGALEQEEEEEEEEEMG